MNAISTTNNNAGLGFPQSQVDLVKSQIFAGKSQPTNDDLALFGMICQRTGLDPFSRQIYAIERGGKWTFQISIDGFRSIADRTGQYAGSDEPRFDEGLTQYECIKQGRKYPTTATVTVWKMVNGQRCAFTATCDWEAYVQKYNGKPSNFWERMPYAMLSKCCESLALRKAFPSQLSGLYTREESRESEEELTATWQDAALQWAHQQGINPDKAIEIIGSSTDKKEAFAKLKLITEEQF